MKILKRIKLSSLSLALMSGVLLSNQATADIVHNDDVITDGSQCIGFDCVNGEVFGFDTIKLKENNLRIKFDDTSVSASFPRNDWQLTANDSANGGSSKFSIDDITGGRTPFTVEAGARSHALFVEDSGDVGFGTNNPAVDLHSVSGDSPTLRLDQDGTSGWAPQVWDIAGNETNFFIRDVTNGSKLPFRIRPDAPTSSLEISGTGNVGIGTSSAAAPLHIKNTDDEMLLLENTSTTNATRRVMRLSNKGPVGFELEDTDLTDNWQFRTDSTGKFVMNKLGNLSTEFNIDGDGDAIFSGEVRANGILLTSSRSSKTDINPIKPANVMEKLKQIEIAEWRYKKADKNDRHISPMAEDFYSLFNLGRDGKSINPNDLASVAIVAAKELQKRADSMNLETTALRAETLTLKADTVAVKLENTLLKDRLASLEKLVTNLASSDNLLPEAGAKVVLMKK